MLLAKLSASGPLRPDMEDWFRQDKCHITHFVHAALEHVFRKLAYTLSFDKTRLGRDIPTLAHRIGEAMGLPTPASSLESSVGVS